MSKITSALLLLIAFGGVSVFGASGGVFSSFSSCPLWSSGLLDRGRLCDAKVWFTGVGRGGQSERGPSLLGFG